MSKARPSKSEFVFAITKLLNVNQKQVQNGVAMLRAHYNAQGRAMSAEDLATAAGMTSHHAGNSHYGKFSHRLCDILNYEPPEGGAESDTRWTYLLATFPGKKNAKGNGLWILRPEVAFALEELGLVRKNTQCNSFDDIEAKRDYLSTLSEKDRAAVIYARMGQGVFRERLILFWGGCAVTGCAKVELLVASHIKPWRECDKSDALDLCNGLLLAPNLDKAFDLGYISFENTGQIILSPMLAPSVAEEFGI